MFPVGTRLTLVPSPCRKRSLLSGARGRDGGVAGCDQRTKASARPPADEPSGRPRHPGAARRGRQSPQKDQPVFQRKRGESASPRSHQQPFFPHFQCHNNDSPQGRVAASLISLETLRTHKVIKNQLLLLFKCTLPTHGAHPLRPRARGPPALLGAAGAPQAGRRAAAKPAVTGRLRLRSAGSLFARARRCAGPSGARWTPAPSPGSAAARAGRAGPREPPWLGRGSPPPPAARRRRRPSSRRTGPGGGGGSGAGEERAAGGGRAEPSGEARRPPPPSREQPRGAGTPGLGARRGGRAPAAGGPCPPRVPVSGHRPALSPGQAATCCVAPPAAAFPRAARRVPGRSSPCRRAPAAAPVRRFAAGAALLCQVPGTLGSGLAASVRGRKSGGAGGSGRGRAAARRTGAGGGAARAAPTRPGVPRPAEGPPLRAARPPGPGMSRRAHGQCPKFPLLTLLDLTLNCEAKPGHLTR